MEQLTQMEYLQIHELLSAEELALKKVQSYASQIQDDELQPYLQTQISTHKEHIQRLLQLMRSHSGKEQVQL